jgi:hypothetical protein
MKNWGEVERNEPESLGVPELSLTWRMAGMMVSR